MQIARYQPSMRQPVPICTSMPMVGYFGNEWRILALIHLLGF
jgi:hypothetical protein